MERDRKATRSSRVPTTRGRLLLGLFLWLGLSPWASAIAPVAPTTPPGTQDEVFRIQTPLGSGTGTVFDAHIIENRYLRFCIATADHVLRGAAPGQVTLGFRSANASLPGGYGPNAFDFVPFQESIALGGNGVPVAGGGRDTPDIAFLGVTVDLQNVGGTRNGVPITGPSFSNATQAALLSSIETNNEAIPLGTFTDGTFPAFSLTGYGRSGRAPTAAELAANPAVANLNPAAQYIFHFGGAADEQYGIERTMNDSVTINEFQNAQNGTLYNPLYRFHVAEEWQLTPGASFAQQGDSGSAMVTGGQIEGIFVANESRYYDPVLKTFFNPNVSPPMNGDWQVIQTGNLQIGVGLTQDYTNWLTQDCTNFMASAVPEPATLVLLLTALVVLGIVHHRHLRLPRLAA